MIVVSRLIQLLQRVPPDAQVHAYEGEGIGLVIVYGEKTWWIEAKDTETRDRQDEFFRDCVKHETP